MLYGVYAFASVRVTAMPQPINCVNNLKQIGLAFKTWAIDNQDRFPFNISTNQGGTLELCNRTPDGFDANAARHFAVMSNELSTPIILVCPRDRSKKAAQNFTSLGGANVTYRLRSGTNVTDAASQDILAVCPVHGNILHCDGSVTEETRDASPSRDKLRIYWLYDDDFRQAEQWALGGLLGAFLLFCAGVFLKSFSKETIR